MYNNDLRGNKFRCTATIYKPMVELLKGKGTCVELQHITSMVKTVLSSNILTEHILTEHKDAKHVKKSITLHNTCGFIVNELIADIEFACIKDKSIPVLLNLVTRGEHCGDIESSIMFLKECL